VGNESLLISAAIFAAAVGALVTVLEHIRHPPVRPVINFTGIAGVYLGSGPKPSMWPGCMVPCLILLLAATAAQLRSSRPSGRTGDDRPVGGIS
jgi:hypothetical protein